MNSLLALLMGIFSKRPSRLKIIDKVYISTEAKWAACKTISTAETLFIAWFPETLDDFTRSTGLTGQLARESHGMRHENKMVVFLEHYPLYQPEEKLFTDLALPEVLVLSALDEPFFQFFTENKLADLIEKLGLDPNEAIEHSLVTRSIRTAQEKLADKKLVDHTTESQKKWFENL